LKKQFRRFPKHCLLTTCEAAAELLRQRCLLLLHWNWVRHVETWSDPRHLAHADSAD
jgi:hypothetical protein